MGSSHNWVQIEACAWHEPVVRVFPYAYCTSLANSKPSLHSPVILSLLLCIT